MNQSTISHLHYREGYEGVDTELLSSYQAKTVNGVFCYIRKTYDGGRCDQAIIGYITDNTHIQEVHRYSSQNPPSQWRLCHAIKRGGVL